MAVVVLCQGPMPFLQLLHESQIKGLFISSIFALAVRQINLKKQPKFCPVQLILKEAWQPY